MIQTPTISPISPLDEYRTPISNWLSNGLSQSQIVSNLNEMGVSSSRRSVQRAIKRWQREEDYTPMREEYTPLPTRTTELTFRQREVDLLLPARVPGPRVRVTSPIHQQREPKLIAVFGDQQAPHYDQRLHELACEWLRENKPEEAVLLGDLMDLPDVSRHLVDPNYNSDTQTCINSAYQLLLDYREASPETQWTKLYGNHEERLRTAMLDRMRELYGIKRAELPDAEQQEPLYSPAYLLRLDELDINYVSNESSYKYTQVKLSKHLAVRHGWISRKGSGSSALQTLQHLRHSIIVGHSHRRSLVFHTVHSIDGEPHELAAAEAGCMCNISEGLGYAVNPDWQAGFCTAQIWDDGQFLIDHGVYTSGTLLWKNQRYR